jgi:hypothetical protein
MSGQGAIQSCAKVADEIVGSLDADGEAQERFGNAGSAQRFGAHRCVRHAGRVGHETLDAALRLFEQETLV